MSSHTVQRTMDALRRRHAGMTLIELMVALAIGAFLMIGAVKVFMQGRTTFRITESISRLQENGRFALDAIEPDIRMAHFFGLTARTTKIQNRAGPADPNGLGVDTCGVNWLIDFDNSIQATNGSAPFPWACAAWSGAAANADTLVVRRVAQDVTAPAALTAGQMYIHSARFVDAQIFQGPPAPSGFNPTTSETHAMVVNGYYIDNGSALGPNIPSLRRKFLQADGRIGDEEVLPGVEDMQIQLGVDMDATGQPNRGSIDRYVNPGDPIITPGNAAFNPDAEILAVRIWLRVRAENIENGFTDTTVYQYADQNVGPFGDNFRRIVVSKTIYLRNARPPA